MRDFVNAGHGDTDSGAVGQNGTKEKDITKIVTSKVVDLLRFNGETSESYQSGNLDSISLNANAWNADLFCSIHCNSATDHSAHGVETFALQAGGKGEQLAKYILEELVAVTGLTNRGVKFANFSVLRKTTMPAVLVELAFISNLAEEALLNDPAFQDKVARAIARGMLRMSGKELKLPTAQPVSKWLIKVNGVQTASCNTSDEAVAEFNKQAATVAPGAKMQIVNPQGQVTTDWTKPTPTVTPPVEVKPTETELPQEPPIVESTDEAFYKTIGKAIVEIFRAIFAYFGVATKK